MKNQYKTKWSKNLPKMFKKGQVGKNKKKEGDYHVLQKTREKSNSNKNKESAYDHFIQYFFNGNRSLFL